MKILIIVELLFTAECATVTVLHTNHWYQGDTGKHFFFDANDFSKMVGGEDWNTKKYEVIQRGSKSWTGTILVYGDENHGPHGKRDSGANEGDWTQGDKIQLKACFESGF